MWRAGERKERESERAANYFVLLTQFRSVFIYISRIARVCVCARAQYVNVSVLIQ